MRPTLRIKRITTEGLGTSEMPYSIQKHGKSQFDLILKSTGKVLGTHPSKEAAKKQIAAIEASKASK